MASRGGEQAVTPGSAHEVVTASLDSPADLGVLLCVADALRGRSSVLPLVLVAQGTTSYVAQLTPTELEGRLAVEVGMPGGASRDDLEALAVNLVTSL